MEPPPAGPAAAARTHPEISTGVRWLRPRGVSIWRARSGGSQGAPAQGRGAPVGPSPAGTRRSGSRLGEPAAALGTGGHSPGSRGALQKEFLRRLESPKRPRNTLTCCPARVGGCLRRRAGPVTAAGHTDALPGAWGGDGASLGDTEPAAYRLLAGQRGTDGGNPLAAKTGLVGSPLCRARSHACALWHRRVHSPRWALR